jgi:hypothetical protein
LLTTRLDEFNVDDKQMTGFEEKLALLIAFELQSWLLTLLVGLPVLFLNANER